MFTTWLLTDWPHPLLRWRLECRLSTLLSRGARALRMMSMCAGWYPCSAGMHVLILRVFKCFHSKCMHSWLKPQTSSLTSCSIVPVSFFMFWPYWCSCSASSPPSVRLHWVHAVHQARLVLGCAECMQIFNPCFLLVFSIHLLL